MSKVLKKAMKFIQADNKKLRLISFINKSSFRFLVKTFLNLIHSRQVAARKKPLTSLRLDADEQQAVDQLNRLGYARITHLVSPEALAQLEKKAQDRQQASNQLELEQTQTNKDFWVRLTDQEFKNDLNTENAFVKFALQEKPLRVASFYLKKVAFLEYVLLTLSKGSNEPLKSSQLWHLDYDNVGMLKMFVYLNDVPETQFGPFTFADKEQSAKVKTNALASHLEDQEFFKYVSENQVTEMTAPKLSVFMVDTSRCYHMGSRLKLGFERLMFTVLYLDLPSIYPWSGFQKIKNVSPDLSDLQKMAITP